MLSRITFIVLFFIFSCYRIYAGNKDSVFSVKKNQTTFFFNQNQFEYDDSVSYINNTLYNFQNYLPRAHLGNSGLAFSDLNFRPSVSPCLGFNYFKNNFENYFYTPHHIKFYNTRTPYTDLFYVAGSKLEQFFKMTFSYNVKKNWNVTANFYRIRSEGFYKRQNTNNNFIAVSSNYRSNNGKYFLLAGIFYNNVKNSENGGIVDDSIFENTNQIDKKLIAINLLSAKRSVLNRSIFIKHYLNLGRTTNDTSAYTTSTPRSRLILSTLVDDHLLKYSDENVPNTYYSNFHYDPINTTDSAYTAKIENELTWKHVNFGNYQDKKLQGLQNLLGIALSAKHQFIIIKQREIDTAFNNIIAGAQLYNRYSNHKLWWNITGNYCIEGYNKTDYTGSAIIKKGIIDSLSFLSFQVEAKLQAPDFIYQRYSSNHFRWNNSFTQMQKTRMAIDLFIKKYDFALGADYSQHTNVLYFDNYAIARQYKGSIAVLSAYLKKDITFYNWHFNNKIIYQNVPDSTVIRLPQFISEHSLYYENDVLKGAMLLQIGASLFYTTAYYANDYMPATAQFYLQNNKKYGNYPFIDFFINAQIKTVRIFIKIDHLNYGWMGNDYMLIPNYPINDRAFKFGVSWRFFD